MKRYNAVIGITAVLLNISTIIIMAELRTDGYNHFHKAVSELGSLDAPNKWVFNMLGYFTPGILTAVFAYNLKDQFRNVHAKAYPFYLFAFSGLLMALAGIFPANMENRESLTTVLHSVGSLGSGLCWFLCALTLCWQFKKNHAWKRVAIVTFIIPFITIVLILLVPQNMPGIAQRIGFAGNNLFILVLAIKSASYLGLVTNKNR